MEPLRITTDWPLTHQLPRRVFDQMCSGAVTEEFVSAIGASQYSRRKFLVRALVDFCAAHRETSGPLTDVELLWEILLTVEEHDPVLIREILTYPTVGVWATRTLRKAYGHSPDSIPLWSEFGYLHSLVAAAAVRSGVACHIRVPVVRGVVTLPTVGQIQLPTSFPAGFAEVRNTPNGMELRTSVDKTVIDLSGRHFFPARRHITTSRGLRFELEINDGDPYREFSRPVPPHRLDATAFAEWGKLLNEAFDILTLWHPEYARELAAGLTMLTPLVPGSTVKGASSSAAFGCVAVSGKNSATELAETLVHEFQHSKVNGILDLFDIGRKDNLYAPWKDDPRPLTGLLHGLFAFTSVVEFWRVQRNLVPEQEMKAAHFTFALRRHQVRAALSALRHQAELTDIGRQLVTGIHRRLTNTEQDPVSADLRDAVEQIADDHLADWRIRHVRPDPESVEQLASAWLANVSTPPIVPGHVIPDLRSTKRSTRRDLLELKAVDPEVFAAVVRRSAVPPADAAYVSGDHSGATSAYLTQLHNRPDDRDSWVGLGMSLRAQGNLGAAAIMAMPETVFAVHNRILSQTGSAPDPVSLATWIGESPAGVE